MKLYRASRLGSAGTLVKGPAFSLLSVALILGSLPVSAHPRAASALAPQAGPGGWMPTGSLAFGRYYHTATLLPNGKVLVVGGSGTAGAELYDPATGTWEAAASLAEGRHRHTATLLADGRVLVAGGGASSPRIAEVYDPTTGVWTQTGSLKKGRYGHTATPLPDGRVLVAGGYKTGAHGGGPYHRTAEIYDPATGRWRRAGALARPRINHTATLLADGRVLVAGGASLRAGSLASAEIYDPATGRWSPTGSLATARFDHSATALPDGRVFVAGGTLFPLPSGGAEVYDPATGAWSEASSLAEPRRGHTATLLADGRVLIVGGTGSGGPPGTGAVLGSAEAYDPTTDAWAPAGSLGAARWGHTATLLLDARVLVAGGLGDVTPSTDAEVYDPR